MVRVVFSCVVECDDDDDDEDYSQAPAAQAKISKSVGTGGRRGIEDFSQEQATAMTEGRTTSLLIKERSDADNVFCNHSEGESAKE